RRLRPPPQPSPTALLGQAPPPRGQRADHLRPRRAAAVGLGSAARQGQRHHRRPTPPPARESGEAARPVGGPGLPRPRRRGYRLSPSPRRAVDRRPARREPTARQPALPGRTWQRPAEVVPRAGHRATLPPVPLHPHDQSCADRLLPRADPVRRIDSRISRHPTNMIKTLACRKAESTVLSNQAVSCDNTTMNQAQWLRTVRTRSTTLPGRSGYLAAGMRPPPISVRSTVT